MQAHEEIKDDQNGDDDIEMVEEVEDNPVAFIVPQTVQLPVSNSVNQIAEEEEEEKKTTLV